MWERTWERGFAAIVATLSGRVGTEAFAGNSRLYRDVLPAEMSVLVSVGSPLSFAKRGQLTGQFHVVVYRQFLWPESRFEA